jgi:2-oxoglutarate ferredoxin oxidoreductase subunit alpha
VGWGSTEGALKEAVDWLRGEGIDAGCINFVDIWPFPIEQAKEVLNKGTKLFMVEQNSTAQLGQLIREQTGLVYSGAILKYDGRPFYPYEIVDGVKQYLR